MSEVVNASRWRVAWGPGQDDEDGDEWAVVFRTDDSDRNAEGPQITVVCTANADYDVYDPESSAINAEEYTWTTRADFQVWAQAGKLIAEAGREAPYGWHGYEPDIGEARNTAASVVQQFADDPGYWEWDGTAESMGLEAPMPDWLDVPAGAVLSLRRQSHARTREQWAIVPDDVGFTVQRAISGEKTWHEASPVPFGTVADALAGIPEIRTLHEDTINIFKLMPEAKMSEHSFVAMLDLCPDDKDGSPASWEAADLRACGWPDIALWPERWAPWPKRGRRPWAYELLWPERLACVNGTVISGITHDGRCFPARFDVDGPIEIETLARAALSMYGGSPAGGWDFGFDLLLLAPGLACSRPWGEHPNENGEDRLIPVGFPAPSAAESMIAEALAAWLTDIAFDFWAALVLEPLDPAGELTEQERKAWDEFEEGTLMLSPTLDVPPGVRNELREALARQSASYRHARNARAEPHGRAAQVMLASNRPALHYGTWIRPLYSLSFNRHKKRPFPPCWVLPHIPSREETAALHTRPRPMWRLCSPYGDPDGTRPVGEHPTHQPRRRPTAPCVNVGRIFHRCRHPYHGHPNPGELRLTLHLTGPGSARDRSG